MLLRSASNSIFSRALGVAALATSLLSACDKGDEGEAAATGAAAATAASGTPAASGEAKPEEAETPPVIDEALVAELRTIAEKCEVDTKFGSVKNCPNDENGELRKAFRKRDRAAAIDTFSSLMSGEDEKLRITAAVMADGALGDFDDDAKISKSAAKRYIEALGKLDKKLAQRALGPSIHAAVLGDALEEFYAMLDAHQDKGMWSSALRGLPKRGRTAVLPKLKEMAAGDDPRLTAAALNGPRRISKVTDAEKAEVCPWAATFIGHADRNVWEEAGHTALWCGGEYIDKILAQGEKELAANTFDRNSYLVFRDVCFKGAFGTGAAGNEAQCAKTYALLQGAVDNESVDAKARGLALFGIYYQRRNEESLALMQTYAKSKVPEIRERAEEAIESLNKHYIKK